MNEADDARAFLDAYEAVRRDEAWGGDDLDLPFHPKRHRAIWQVRRRTFLAFETLATQMTRGVALDVGAGNCWLTRYLSGWGFDAIAVDINTSDLDGLGAGQTFIDQGARFLRVRAAMERLPFVSARTSLIVANASFHYARDFHAALVEFARVLAPGGTVAIVDTPVYEHVADGERMMADRAAEFRRKYDMPEAVSRWSRFLTFADVARLAGSLGLAHDIIPVWPGLRRKYEEVRARAFGRRIAQFPIILLRKAEPLGFPGTEF